MEMKKLVKGLTAAGIIAIAGNSFAATDGVLGPTSTGTVDINVDVGTQVRITGLQDMTGNFYVTGDITDSTPACIYRNSGADYEITATSSFGVGTNFFLDDGAGNVVLYDVDFDDGSGATDLDNAVTDSTFTGADQVSETCVGSGGSNAVVSITVPELGVNGLGAATDGLYTDVLSIEVAPR